MELVEIRYALLHANNPLIDGTVCNFVTVGAQPSACGGATSGAALGGLR
jgi:hypothetical protein